jgi:hypothetical protein
VKVSKQSSDLTPNRRPRCSDGNRMVPSGTSHASGAGGLACDSLCSGVYWRHGGHKTFHRPLSPKLGNGRARSLRGGLRRGPQCAKVIPQGRSGARLLSILAGEMQATPDRPHGTKTEIENYCRKRFRVTVDSFQYCWREAIMVTGAHWDQPGRPPGRKSSR